MIWATVSSRSCFCWLNKASPFLAAKNIINLILVLTIWWCPCVESSLVLLEEGVCNDQCILLAKLCKPFPCFTLYSKAKLTCYQVSLDFLLLHFSPLWWKGDLFLVLVLESLVGLHRLVTQLLQHYWLGHRLGLLWCWVVALEMTWDRSAIFEIEPKYCISESFVDYKGALYLSKGSCPQ